MLTTIELAQILDPVLPNAKPLQARVKDAQLDLSSGMLQRTPVSQINDSLSWKPTFCCIYGSLNFMHRVLTLAGEFMLNSFNF